MRSEEELDAKEASEQQPSDPDIREDCYWHDRGDNYNYGMPYCDFHDGEELRCGEGCNQLTLFRKGEWVKVTNSEGKKNNPLKT